MRESAEEGKLRRAGATHLHEDKDSSESESDDLESLLDDCEWTETISRRFRRELGAESSQIPTQIPETVPKLRSLRLMMLSASGTSAGVPPITVAGGAGVAYERSLAHSTSFDERPTPRATVGRARARAVRYELRNEVDRGVRVGVEVQRVRCRRREDGVEGRGAWRRRVASGVGQRAANMLLCYLGEH